MESQSAVKESQIMQRHQLARYGAFNVALAIIFGAFGAHALRESLDAYSLDVFQKAVFYQAIHGLGLLLVATLSESLAIDRGRVAKVGALIVIGILFFCGSLYCLALTGIKWFGAITPIGGVAFIVAWLLLAASCRSAPQRQR